MKSRFSIVTESNRFTMALPMPFDIADALNITTTAAASFHTIRPLFHSLFQRLRGVTHTACLANCLLPKFSLTPTVMIAIQFLFLVWYSPVRTLRTKQNNMLSETSYPRKTNVSNDVNFEELVRPTDDFNGAQCKAEAGMIALRRPATQVTHKDIMDAIMEVQAKKKANLNHYA
uniref:Uncharacterized protein n=1 Tax=Glossina austeni TaxID=7395 RepID=A0A1A9UMF4_GLOAU